MSTKKTFEEPVSFCGTVFFLFFPFFKTFDLCLEKKVEKKRVGVPVPVRSRLKKLNFTTKESL
tara:strand:+ start:699 stop:887 length:189 start_codon:yes stop_codon:yes gene_type:complete